jgi:small-conductance mechanosensitive channel
LPQLRPIALFGYAFSPLIVLPVALLGLVFLGWTAKKLVFLWFRRLSERSETQIDDVLVYAAELPISLMIFVWSVTATLHLAGNSIPDRWSHNALIGAKIGTLLALILFVDRLLSSLFRAGARKYDVIRHSEAFGSVLVHVLVYFLGALVVLDSIGISITPIVASLGLGSLAVALALQPTLENFISGFQILVDRPIQPGNYIRLESGEEGFVDRIGWRSTWVRQGLNNMIILPNKLLVNARVLNYDYPSQDLIVPVTMGVHYGSDLHKVETVTIEVAREVLKRVPGGVPEFEPVVRFNKFSASSIDFVTVLRAKSFMDSGLVIHEFMKAVTSRYARENIVMPFPIVALNTSQEAATFKPS